MTETPGAWWESLTDRITSDKTIFGGRPCVGGRVLVSRALDRLAEGATADEVMSELGLSLADVRACCAFAARLLRSQSVEIEPV